MNTLIRPIFLSACAAMLLTPVCRAEPQDFWHKESAWMMTTSTASDVALLNATWLETGPDDSLYVIDSQTRMLYRYTEDGDVIKRVGNDLFDDITGVATDASGNLLLLTDNTGNGDILFYSPQLTPAGRIALTNLVSHSPHSLCVNSRSELHVAEGSTVFVYVAFGPALRTFTALGTIKGLAIGPDDQIYVLDTSGVTIYDRLGAFIRRFDVQGNSNAVLVGRDGTVYVRYSSRYFYVYDSLGKLLRRWNEGSLFGGETAFRNFSGVKVLPDGRILTIARQWDNSQPSWLMTYRRSAYAFQSATPQALPLPRVASISQRVGNPILDVDYEVLDADDASVHTAVYALRAPNADLLGLSNFFPVVSLIEGTDSNIGPNTPTSQVLRLTWDAAADISTNVIDVSVHVAARDSSEMLAFDFITIPSNGVDPEFTINRVPIFQTDLLPLWFWLAATGDSEVSLVNGSLMGTAAAGGSYNGLVLAYGRHTTELGFEYLFDRMGLRLPTALELQRAREGSTPGTINEYVPRERVEQYPFPIGDDNVDRPYRINEYGFDTGNWNWIYRNSKPPWYSFAVKKQ